MRRANHIHMWVYAWTEYQYVRINSDAALNVMEVQGFDSSGQLLSTVGAMLSSTWPLQAYHASNCADGDFDTMCHSASSDDDPHPWLWVKFEPTAVIAQITVTNRPSHLDRIVGATISWSTNDQGTEPVWAATFEAAEPSYQFFPGTPHELDTCKW
jgi:hypothetical protein